MNCTEKAGIVTLTVLFVIAAAGVLAQKPPSVAESRDEPVKYTGDLQPDIQFFDGLLPHVVGVHHFQVMRANRSHPPERGESERVGWTYNHQPYLAFWNGRFYYQYLSNRIEEHGAPGRTLLMTSEDGFHWLEPVVVFPQYDLPEIRIGKGTVETGAEAARKHDVIYEDYTIPAGAKSVMHQRMGFYIAPNGRLLTSGFYSFCATPYHSPNAGNGLGRVVREVYKDGTFGPVYFIRYNRHAGWNEKNTNFPFYTKSKDRGFIKACEALLADKLVTLQWWEEDRAEDGFYTINPGDVENAAYFSANIVTSKGAGKAFCYYERPDGVLVGLWKNTYAALSTDNGKTWTKISQNPTLWTTGAKTWGQRTEDGRYIIVHNHSASKRNRFPMSILVSEDGHIFDRLFALSGEVPVKRYHGIHKNPGLQYFRGIFPGNGNPPGDHLWMTHSMNKEDMWIARARLPIRADVDAHVDQDFESIEKVTDLEFWTLYVPQWAPVRIVQDPVTGTRCLELRDEDPYDYAKVERIFPGSKAVEISFRLNPKGISQGYALEIEVQSQRGGRPMRLRVDQRFLGVDHKGVETNPVPVVMGEWIDVMLKMDCGKQKYDLIVGGRPTITDIPFEEEVASLERIVFRTGPYRNFVLLETINGQPNASGMLTEDMPGADEKVPVCVYWIDDVKTKGK
jgi:hypothetical protein